MLSRLAVFFFDGASGVVAPVPPPPEDITGGGPDRSDEHEVAAFLDAKLADARLRYAREVPADVEKAVETVFQDAAPQGEPDSGSASTSQPEPPQSSTPAVAAEIAAARFAGMDSALAASERAMAEAADKLRALGEKLAARRRRKMIAAMIAAIDDD